VHQTGEQQMLTVTMSEQQMLTVTISELHVSALKRLIHNREVSVRVPPGDKLSFLEVFFIFLDPSKRILEKNGEFCHDCFLAYPFQLIVRLFISLECTTSVADAAQLYNLKQS
jgi:hypothetical protein